MHRGRTGIANLERVDHLIAGNDTVRRRQLDGFSTVLNRSDFDFSDRFYNQPIQGGLTTRSSRRAHRKQRQGRGTHYDRPVHKFS
jgi:hypothetical protein